MVLIFEGYVPTVAPSLSCALKLHFSEGAVLPPQSFLFIVVNMWFVSFLVTYLFYSLLPTFLFITSTIFFKNLFGVGESNKSKIQLLE